MNHSSSHFWFPALAGAFLLSLVSLGQAQVVTTGIVVGVAPEGGVVSIQSDQSHRLVDFRGMDRVEILRSSGAPATLADVWSGMRVTISYVQRGDRLYVGSLAIPDPPPPPPSDDWIWLLTPGEREAFLTPRSDDITRRSGNRAFTDNDITIKPPRRGLFENDITLRNDNH